MNLDKAIHTLEGILKGIGIDSVIAEEEVRELSRWRTEHLEFASHHPFTEVMPKVDAALQDGVISMDERDDLLWVCNNLHTESTYYDAVTSDIQRLHGMLHGLLADGVLTDDEIRKLSAWVSENDHLKGCYPFDEIDSLLTAILSDGKIEDCERLRLKTFLADFVVVGCVPRENTGTRHLTVSGVCAMCPEIGFGEKSFCLTGESRKASRAEIAREIELRGGKMLGNIREDLDYLVVCAAGNHCWAFSCYGRKVEKAVEYRKKGARIVIAHENDLWDAIADKKA
jgi:NAD-dependent DNA ligase